MCCAGEVQARQQGTAAFVQLRVDGHRLRSKRRALVLADGKQAGFAKTQVCSSSTADCPARHSSWLPYPGNDDDDDFEQIGCGAKQAVLSSS